MNLVISGGGVKAYAAIGALRILEKETYFSKIAGVSAGSIIASLLALGCDSYCIQTLYDKMDLSKYVLKYYNIFTYLKIICRRGIYNTEEFKNKTIHTLLQEACGDGDITFKQVFEKYAKVLVISGCSITKAETHYYHYISNPDMKIKDAIAISCCVPFLFTPIIWKEDTLVDGGVIENYPLYFFKDNKLPNSKLSRVIDNKTQLDKDTIGIAFLNNNKKEERKDLISFIKSLIFTFLENNEKKYMREDYWEKTIMINVGDVESVTNFNLSKEDKQKLLNAGYYTTKEYVDINQKNSE